MVSCDTLNSSTVSRYGVDKMQTRSILVKVAGVTFEGRQGIISMLSGKEPVRIVAEPDNKFDKNALAVHVSRGGSVEQIGRAHV